jgi:hypothetical protein
MDVMISFLTLMQLFPLIWLFLCKMSKRHIFIYFI